MKTFHITRPDESIRPALIDKINNLTKPKGSLGTLEELALQIGLIQQALSPALKHPQTLSSPPTTALSKKVSVSLQRKSPGSKSVTSFMEGQVSISSAGSTALP